MSGPAIVVDDLHKKFSDTVALNGLSFGVAPGVVTGFVGPNGAGKSTTMRVILGLDAADAGAALVDGRPYVELRRPLLTLGSLLDPNALQPSRSGRNHLLWMARSQSIPTTRVDEVLALVGLDGAGRRRASGYSLGMRQRLGVAAAMLGDPPILMMDEPFNGMDPDGIIWMRGFLRGLAAEGRTVLVSTHLMGELEDMADHVVVIAGGRVLADASIEELLADVSAEDVVVRTGAPTDAARALGDAGGATAPIDGAALRVAGLAPQRIVEALGAAGVPFAEVTARRATLEDAYLRLTRGEVQFVADSDVEAGR